MTNQDVFKEYGSENWVIVENLGYLLQLYWDKLRESYPDRRLSDFYSPPINTVGFVKDFMKSETYVETEWAEKSKINSVEKSVIIDADVKEL